MVRLVHLGRGGGVKVFGNLRNSVDHFAFCSTVGHVGNKWAELIVCHVRKTSASRTRRDMFRFGFS